MKCTQIPIIDIWVYFRLHNQVILSSRHPPRPLTLQNPRNERFTMSTCCWKKSRRKILSERREPSIWSQYFPWSSKCTIKKKHSYIFLKIWVFFDFKIIFFDEKIKLWFFPSSQIDAKFYALSIGDIFRAFWAPFRKVMVGWFQVQKCNKIGLSCSQ